MKKITVLATAVILIVVVLIFELYIFKPPTTIPVMNDPSAWVNKEVVLEGSMEGPVITPGDMNLPYNYELNSSGQTIGLTFRASVNLSTFYSDQYFDAGTANGTIRVYYLNSNITVKIYGVVKQGEVRYGWGMPSRVTYYIDAEKVEAA